MTVTMVIGSVTPASGGAAEHRLHFRRPALRVTKVSPGDVGRRICRVMRRCALFLITSLPFAVSMNVFFNSIKWFFHLPQNATAGNGTMESDEVDGASITRKICLGAEVVRRVGGSDGRFPLRTLKAARIMTTFIGTCLQLDDHECKKHEKSTTFVGLISIGCSNYDGGPFEGRKSSLKSY
ncbi:hypothetical protein TSMEX_003395 [Taenia solium]|eukprot:TsM_000705000 transcript=TsM_000705000 gene=TsM_000705000